MGCFAKGMLHVALLGNAARYAEEDTQRKLLCGMLLAMWDAAGNVGCCIACMWYAMWYAMPMSCCMWYAVGCNVICNVECNVECNVVCKVVSRESCYVVCNVVAMWLLAMWDNGLVAMWTAGLLAKWNAANAAMQMISLQLLSNCGAQNLSQSASRKRYWRNPNH